MVFTSPFPLNEGPILTGNNVSAASLGEPAMAEPVRRVRILLDDTPGWTRIPLADGCLWAAGPLPEVTPDTFVTMKKEGLLDAVRALDGHFAFVLQRGSDVVAVVDQIRSIPLVWAQIGGDLIVAQTVAAVRAAFPEAVSGFDVPACFALAASGYTIGSSTRFEGVKSLLPGKALLIEGGDIAILSYARWLPQPAAGDRASDHAYQKALVDQNEAMIERLMDSAQGRPILVPISAGYDSRLILSGLVAAGYDNVRSFSYGRQGNREATIGKQIADRLGVPWHWEEYSRGRLRKYFKTDAHSRFLEHSDSGTSMPFLQDHAALTWMKMAGVLDSDSIIVNGQSGDFISGNHVPLSLADHTLEGGRSGGEPGLIDLLIAKHYRLWTGLIDDDQEASVVAQLSATVHELSRNEEHVPDACMYEAIEFINRQSKYVVSGQRSYEEIGVSWRLPLWDPSYCRFWESVPIELKREQRLYREVAHSTDWGGVWSDIPINPIRLRPLWIIPLRWIAKAVFGFGGKVGKRGWKTFERQMLAYWMSGLSGYACVDYRTVAFDRRGFRNETAWQNEVFLNRVGLDWRGRPSVKRLG